MYLPLGESPENIKIGRVKVRILLVLFGLALAVGVFAVARASWALVQNVSNTSCPRNGNACTVTIGATGSGNVLIVATWNVSANNVLSVNGAGAWTECSHCEQSSFSGTNEDVLYILSSTSGATSITMNLVNPGCTAGGCHWTTEVLEYSNAGGSASLDNSDGFVDGSCTTCAGRALTLTGTNDLIVQSVISNNTITAITSPYTNPADFPNNSTVGGGIAGSINTTDGSAPNWTQSSSDIVGVIALAFSENSHAILTQRAFIFENDNGPTVNQNTTSTNGTLQAEKGQRFIARFQVDDTGAAGSTTTQYAVQFDHNDGVFNTVTSGEISVQLGISGSNGAGITSNKVGSCQGATSFQTGEWFEGTRSWGKLPRIGRLPA
jgi:hypothetical protein